MKYRTEADVTVVNTADPDMVSGEINDMWLRQPYDVDPTETPNTVNGSLTLGAAPISGNGFTGAVTADAGFTDQVGSIAAGSSYSGTFFGPGAEEVAGGINLTGTSAGGAASLGWGIWQAN